MEVAEAGSPTTSRNVSTASRYARIDAVDRPVGRDREAVDYRVNRVAQVFEARYERHIQLAGRQFTAKSRRVIETNRATPPIDERKRVEVPDAAEPEGIACLHLRRRPVRRRHAKRPGPGGRIQAT